MEHQTVAVIGAGTMGRGIIETAAVHGCQVVAIEVDTAQQERARGQIEKSLEKAIRRKKIELDSPAEALDRIAWHSQIAGAVESAPFVIEAVPEIETLKTGILRELDQLCGPETILATNTSSISVTRLAATTSRGDRIVGMHFFNPVPIMEPVEIVCGLETSEQTVEATRELAGRLGKQAFVVQDMPGFAVNRILMPLINEAIFTLQEGVADAATIDSLMKLGCNHPMGPLELADFIGLDVCLSILKVLHEGLGDPKFRPCPLLIRMVDGGRLGRKSGRGFYSY